MNIYQYFIIAIFTAICSLLIKRRNPEFSLVLSIAGVVFMFLTGVTYISQVINDISILNLIDEDFLTIPLKLLGLTLITKITCSICEDAGEKGLAVSTQTISKFACVGIAFPLFEKLLEQIEVALSI